MTLCPISTYLPAWMLRAELGTYFPHRNPNLEKRKRKKRGKKREKKGERKRKKGKEKEKVSDYKLDSAPSQKTLQHIGF